MSALTVAPDTETKPAAKKNGKTSESTEVVPVENASRALTAEELTAEQDKAEVEAKEAGALEKDEVVSIRRAFHKNAEAMGKQLTLLRAANNWMNDPLSSENHCSSFREYCDKVLRTSEADASRKIHHFKVTQVLPKNLQPALESQSRALINVPESKWVEVMTSANEMAEKLKANVDAPKKLTAKLIEDAAVPFVEKPAQVRTPKGGVVGIKETKTTPVAEAPKEGGIATPEVFEEDVVPGFGLSDIPVYVGKKELAIEGYADLFELSFEYPEKDGKESYIRKIPVFMRPEAVKEVDADVPSEEDADGDENTGDSLEGGS